MTPLAKWAVGVLTTALFTFAGYVLSSLAPLAPAVYRMEAETDALHAKDKMMEARLIRFEDKLDDVRDSVHRIEIGMERK